MKKEELDALAKAHFAKNKGVNKVYLTSDGCIFNAEHYALDWRRGLNDKNVYPYIRWDFEKQPAKEDAAVIEPGAGDSAPVDEKAAKAEERNALIARYIELYDTKPKGNPGIDKLNAMIAEAEAKLAETEANEGEGQNGESGADETAGKE